MAKSRVEPFTVEGGYETYGRSYASGRSKDKRMWRDVHTVKGVDIAGQGQRSRKVDLSGDVIKGSRARKELAKRLSAMKKQAKAGTITSDQRRYLRGESQVVEQHARTMQKRWPAGRPNGGQFAPKGG